MLLVNLGTPEDASPNAVKRFLTEFLTDERVINLPKLIRILLVKFIIIPLRLKKVSHAYQSIALPQGLPMRVYHQKLQEKLAVTLNNLTSNADTKIDYTVSLGMRYGRPSIAEGADLLKDCETVTVLSLYPQYTTSTSVSAIDACMLALESYTGIKRIEIVRNFYEHPQYINAMAQHIQYYLPKNDFLIFSYHGLPVQQNNLTEISYEQQCLNTSRLLAMTLGLAQDGYTTGFQSRLGSLPWIQPYLDQVLINTIQKGIKNIAIVSPSFMTDCLETLEEIAIQVKERWLELGGERMTFIPCLNDSDQSVAVLLALI